MFYDNFSQDQICGIFTLWHFVAIGVFFLLAFLALWFSRKLNEKQTKIILWVIAITVTVLEIIKIIIRVYKHENYNKWLPFYFCSLFIYAIWLTLCKNKVMKDIGMTFIVFGGIVASVCNMIYPTTSLMLYPIWHPGVLHSMFYHWLMFYTGILILIKRMYSPKLSHFFHYCGFVTFFSVIAVILNYYLQTNMMFMGNPFGLDILKQIYNVSKYLYMLIVYLGQGVALFLAEFGIYKLVVLIKQKITEKKSTKKQV